MHFEGITVVSKNRDVVDFFNDYVELKLPCEIINELEENYRVASTVVLFDIRALIGIDVDEFKLQYSPEFLERLIFIIPFEVSEMMRAFIIENVNYHIPFPCGSNYIRKYVEGFILSYLPKDKQVDESRLPSVFSAEVMLKKYLQGESEQMRKVRERILALSRRDGPVLLLGESGTGKTTAANVIHRLSYRGKNKFVPINVSTIPDPLAESTLFGSKSGAFTDAKNRDGIFMAANGGSLFLDEIGTASERLQSKLLTAIESGLIYKVGSNLPTKVDVRLIFATNENLRSKIENKLFRVDLYYRMAANIVTIPPLRERREDIGNISQNIVQKEGKALSYNAMRKLEEYSWPGNVRELQNCLTRALCSSKSAIIEKEDITFDCIQ